jgi:hypothetical protein
MLGVPEVGDCPGVSNSMARTDASPRNFAVGHRRYDFVVIHIFLCHDSCPSSQPYQRLLFVFSSIGLTLLEIASRL